MYSCEQYMEDNLSYAYYWAADWRKGRTLITLKQPVLEKPVSHFCLKIGQMWLLTEIFENGVKIQMNAKIVHQEPIHVFVRWRT